jgi:hypothetical protein
VAEVPTNGPDRTSSTQSSGIGVTINAPFAPHVLALLTCTKKLPIIWGPVRVRIAPVTAAPTACDPHHHL